MKLQRLFFMILIASLTMPVISFGQGGAPGDVPPPPQDVPDPNTTAIPFDGLTTILIAAGAGYALKKGRAAKKRKEEETAQ